MKDTMHGLSKEQHKKQAERGGKTPQKGKIYEEESSFLETLFSIIIALAPFIFVVIGIVAVSKSGYGYINNKKIDKKETPFFRDIPCNKDIYYANTLTKLNLELFGNSSIVGKSFTILSRSSIAYFGISSSLLLQPIVIIAVDGAKV